MRNKGFNPPDTHKEAKRLRFLRSIVSVNGAPY